MAIEGNEKVQSSWCPCSL